MSLDSSASVRLLRALVPLITRLLVAQVFLLAGLYKFQDYAAAVGGFEKLGLPAASVLTGIVATVETAGGLAILLGLFTRVAAFLLSGVMVVALATAHAAQFQKAMVLRPEQGAGLVSITAVVMLGFLGWLLAFGPGSLSLDSVRLSRRGRPPGMPASPT